MNPQLKGHDPRVTAVIAACLAATIAFGVYTRTLLRSVDLGDTAALQAAVATQEVSARQAYPLYFALARSFVSLTDPAHPALSLNLFSAAAAALAVAMLTLVSSIVVSSSMAGLAAGLAFAFSYTWWHQAIIAEVYALHLALIGTCMLTLLFCARRPSLPGLGCFLFVYAMSFGNHLSMVLLLLPFAVFLLVVFPRRTLVRPPAIGMAVAMATLGALQYVPLFLAASHSPEAPQGLAATFAGFWFDVTKSDWRDSMVLAVDRTLASDRLAMLWFDARQQFGVTGIALAVVGACRLWRSSRPWAVLVLSAYLLNLAFAGTYNVGDPHVFLLPGHYLTAFMLAGALALPETREQRHLLIRLTSVAAIAYAGWRGYETWPAADRHDDRRAEELVRRLVLGVDERDALLVTDLNWQVENAVRYATRVDHRHVAWIRLGDVLLHFPFLVADNRTAGRDIVLTAAAAARVEASFGPVFPIAADVAASDPSLLSAAERIPRHAPYVLAVLAPSREQPIDPDLFAAVLDTLTGGNLSPRELFPVYSVYAGLAGDRPLVHKVSGRPFRERFTVGGAGVDIRMESWLPAETFRRGGFGHVIYNRRHALTLERGISLVWFDAAGRPSPPIYAGGLYAAAPRFRIPAEGLPELARTSTLTATSSSRTPPLRW